MLNLLKENYDLCTGCEACAQICNSNAITMEMQKDGFLYPKVNEDKCTNCGLCDKVCQIDDKVQRVHLPDYSYATTNSDSSILLESSSGGAFRLITDFLGDDYVVFGAVFDKEMQIVHSSSLDCNISKMQKSKYVQSRTLNTYEQAKQMLISGKKVIYTGTPCQIAGLKGYLRKDYDNLVCIEIICHGVGSPGVFKEYKNYLEKENNSKISEVLFRDKISKFGGWSNYLTTIKFTNNKKISSRFNLYTSAFLQSIILRKSCYNCSYANENRVSDIVLGDFWGVQKVNPELYNKKGVSVIIPVTDKGIDICNGLASKNLITKVPVKNVKESNSSLTQKRKMNNKRDIFFEDLNKKSINEALSTNVYIPSTIKRAVSYMPENFKLLIRKFIK